MPASFALMVFPPLRLGLASGAAVLGLLGLLLAPSAARGQADTARAAPPDSLRQVRPDTTRPPPAESPSTESPPADAAAETPLRPLPFAPPLYGRPVTDSLPGRRPSVSLEALLAERAGGFLYDLGEYGWPHGWSPRGLAPHRVHLRLDGRSFDDPLTGRPRFELLPPSFLARPRVGLDPGGGAVGVHAAWRAYASRRPLTEIRYRFDNSGLHGVEVGHSQKRRLDLFGRPGVLHVTFGYGGRKADGVYDGSALRTERRVWGRLRYQTNNWAVGLTNRASRYRIGAHGGAMPPTPPFSSLYTLPLASTSVRAPRNRRKTLRNDLSLRVRGPLVPGLRRPAELSARWTTYAFDVRDAARDTTWRTRLRGGHAHLRQSVTVGRHRLTGTAQGQLWSVDQSNVPAHLGSVRGAAHVGLRDSLGLGATRLVLHAGGHLTSEQAYPSITLRATRRTGPARLSASVTATGQRGAWIEEAGFAGVRPLDTERGGLADALVEGTVGARARFGPFDLQLRGFAHQIRNAVDLYAVRPAGAEATAYADSVTARRLSTPVRRAGLTLAGGWRRNARRGLYATGRGTLVETLNATASSLHTRLAHTLPTAFGRVRVGARFVLFSDLRTDLYVQARGWSAMHSRWLHPQTGRLVVPPLDNPVPVAGGPAAVGPSGTVDVRAEVQLRSATLFFTFQNVQAATQLQSGTFVVPVYPLPPRQFRFGVFWPIFD